MIINLGLPWGPEDLMILSWTSTNTLSLIFPWMMFLKGDSRMTRYSLERLQTKRHESMSLEKQRNLVNRRILIWLLFPNVYQQVEVLPTLSRVRSPVQLGYHRCTFQQPILYGWVKKMLTTSLRKAFLEMGGKNGILANPRLTSISLARDLQMRIRRWSSHLRNLPSLRKPMSQSLLKIFGTTCTLLMFFKVHSPRILSLCRMMLQQAIRDG